MKRRFNVDLDGIKQGAEKLPGRLPVNWGIENISSNNNNINICH